MKNVVRFLGIVFLVAAIGFSIVACGDGGGSGSEGGGGGGGSTPCTTHSWGEWDVTTPATCVADGTGTRTCIDCGEAYPNNVIPKLGHDYEYDSSAVAPTCTTDGQGLRWCKRDGCDFEENSHYDKLGHDESGPAATCTTAKICARENCTHVITSALEHDFSGSWTTTGNLTKTCQRAGCSAIHTINDEMANIPAGNFVRGGHTITLSAFRMSKFQVTQELYEAVMGNNPSHFQGTATDRVVADREIQGKRPVEMVNWYHAIAFCNRLSILEGLIPAYSITGMSNTDANAWLHSNVPTSNNATWNAVTIVEGSTGYRLPTEAQWEYACRAGSDPTYNWHFGNDENLLVQYAWYGNTSLDAAGRTHQVGLKTHNGWGLHDMYGNVWEWCWDRWSTTFPDPGNLNNPTGPVDGSSRVFRGGCWSNSASDVRSAIRHVNNPSGRINNLGFRFARPY